MNTVAERVENEVRTLAPRAEELQGMSRARAGRSVRKNEARLYTRLTKACEQDPCSHRARDLQRRYLKSFDARLCALLEVNEDLPADRRHSRTSLVQIAEELNPFTGTDEHVTLQTVEKPQGGVRVTMAFGVRHRALQILVRKALTPFAKLHPNQFAGKGRGRNAAAMAVYNALKEGYKWAIEVDIENCFASFDPEQVKGGLPLPASVSEAVVLSQGLNIRMGMSGNRSIAVTSRLSQTRQQGIPQGSKVSPLVAEMLLADALAQLPEGACVFAYADNMLILGKTKREMLEIEQALGCALAQRSAGRLRLKRKCNERRVCDGFNYLGYWFRREGRIVLQPCASTENCCRFIVECSSLVKGMQAGERAAGELRAYVKSWISAFKVWSFSSLWARHKVWALTNHDPSLQRVALEVIA